MTRKEAPVAEELLRFRTRLEDWRRQHAPARRRIPEPLWTAAVELAQRHGLCRTAQTLRLDYSDLKKRVAATASGIPVPLAAFVELMSPAACSVTECALEMETRRGDKLRIQMKAVATADVLSAVRALWSTSL